MKINIEIDCTPDEARTFLGLPDVKPMQAALMDEVQKRMTEGMQAMTPENLLKVWLPASLQGWEDLQRTFWSHVSGVARGLEPKKEG
jgi:hypothetical protein